MREIPEEMTARLSRPATTLGSAWRLTRRDGVVLGFTDHDEDPSFDGTVFRAATGWTAGEAEGALGLAAGTQGIEGALSDAAIREADLMAGLYDGATIEAFRVDWQAPVQFALMEVADLGEVRHGAGGFSAELRGVAARLDRQRGRYYRRRCDAVLGDARCGVDLARPEWNRRGTLVEVRDGALIVAALGAVDRALFSRGRVAIGEDGEWRLVRDLSEGVVAGTMRIGLVEPLAGDASAGNPVRLQAGCDRSFATCRTRFANGVNFRGFAHLPGTDAALGVAKRDALHDGSPVVP